jgi:hypothetical protein
MTDKELEITITEAARLAGRSVATMSRAARLGLLDARKAGPRAWLTTPQAVADWLENEIAHKPGPKPKQTNDKP